MSLLPAPKAILFDWDSTLVDNWDGINAAVNAALKALDLPLINREQTIANSRIPHPDIFPAVFGENWEKGKALFYEHAKNYRIASLKILEGTEPMLQRLASLGLPLGVVSNKKGLLVKEEIAHLNWTQYFQTVVGSGDAAYDKPHHAPIEFACKEMAIKLDESLWVLGDIDTDIQAARAAGATPILIETTCSLNLGLEGDLKTHLPASRVKDAAAFIRLVESHLHPI